MQFNTTDDGVNHLNIYSKAQTEVGRLLSNFAFVPFEHPHFGKFNSIEGFWYYLLSNHSNKEILRQLHGREAKKCGRMLAVGDYPPDLDFEFQKNICEGLQLKYEANPRLQKLLRESTLPLTHYYIYGNKIVVPERGKWIVDFWEDLRNKIKCESNK